MPIIGIDYTLHTVIETNKSLARTRRQITVFFYFARLYHFQKSVKSRTWQKDETKRIICHYRQSWLVLEIPIGPRYNIDYHKTYNYISKAFGINSIKTFAHWFGLSFQIKIRYCRDVLELDLDLDLLILFFYNS